jgi:general secretion pathway protein D
MPPSAPPTAATAPAAGTNTVAAPDPNAKQTFQQSTLTGDEPIEFDWMNADLSQVLSKYSELTHRSAIMQQGMQGMITFRSSGPLSTEEAIGALESVMLVNGYAVVPMGDKFFKVVASPYGPQEGLPVFTEDAKMQQFDRLVAQVVRVKFLDPTDVARALGGSSPTGAPMPGAPQAAGGGASGRVFMHPYGQIIPLPRSSALLLIDTALNVSRLKQIIEYMDTTNETKMETRVYVLENADTTAVYGILQQLIAADQGTGTPGQTGQIMPTSGAVGISLGRSRPSVASIEETVIMGRVLINYDLRTNALILITQETNFTFFEKIIKALDVKTNQDFKTRVFFLNYADAADMANMLYQLVQGAAPTAVGGRAGGTAGSPYTSRAGTATGGRTTGLGGSTSGARSGTSGARGSATGSRTGSRASTSSRSSGARRATTSRATTTANRATTPTVPGTTGAAGANVPQQLIEIIPDERNNALVIFAPEQDLESLADVIKQLDVFPPQVAIDVVVAEVSVDDNTSFGVDIFQKALTTPSRAGAGVSSPDGGGIPGGSGTNALSRLLDPRSLTSPQALAGAGLTGGLTYFASFFGNDLRAVITALSQDSKFKVLQTPHLYTSNNQAARVFVGESRPIVTSTQTTINSDQTRSNYENVDIGVGLEVTPLINPDGVVTFNIYQTVDDVKTTVLIDNNEVPVLSRREAEAVAVTCKDGQIIILGGLTTNNRRQTVNKVPVVGDIPLLGYLFKKTVWTDAKTELVFFLRPKVIRTIEEAQRYTWGRLEKSKDLRTMPIRDVEGYSPMQDKRLNEKLKAIDRFDKSDKF